MNPLRHYRVSLIAEYLTEELKNHRGHTSFRFKLSERDEMTNLILRCHTDIFCIFNYTCDSHALCLLNA